MQIAGRGVGDDEVGLLGKQWLVARAGGSSEDVFEEGLSDEAGGGKEYGFGFGEIELAEQGIEGCLEELFESL